MKAVDLLHNSIRTTLLVGILWPVGATLAQQTDPKVSLLEQFAVAGDVSKMAKSLLPEQLQRIAPEQRQGIVDEVVPFLLQSDTDKNGRLSEAEMRAALERGAPGPTARVFRQILERELENKTPKLSSETVQEIDGAFGIKLGEKLHPSFVDPEQRGDLESKEVVIIKPPMPEPWLVYYTVHLTKKDRLVYQINAHAFFPRTETASGETGMKVPGRLLELYRALYAKHRPTEGKAADVEAGQGPGGRLNLITKGGSANIVNGTRQIVVSPNPAICKIEYIDSALAPASQKGF